MSDTETILGRGETMTTPNDDLDGDADASDPEVEQLNEEAEALGERGFWARNMNGDVVWYEHAEKSRCGGAGYFNCHCGGDLCVCGNQGEIECDGCEDCEGEYDNDSWGDDE